MLTFVGILHSKFGIGRQKEFQELCAMLPCVSVKLSSRAQSLVTLSVSAAANLQSSCGHGRAWGSSGGEGSGQWV